MNTANKRVQFNFLIGVVVGVFIGVTSMILIHPTDDARQRPHDAKPDRRHTSYDLDKTRSEIAEKAKIKTGVANFSSKNEKTGLHLIDSVETDPAVGGIRDSSAVSLATDSLGQNSLVAIADSLGEELIVIREDQLQISLIVRVVDIMKQAESLERDSLASKVSGITEQAEKDTYQIEFWESPIHYKGYKMANNKLVVFGLPIFKNASLYKLHEKMYLKHFEDFYEIEHSYTFKPYTILKDESILANLN